MITGDAQRDHAEDNRGEDVVVLDAAWRKALLGYNGCVRGTNTRECFGYPEVVRRRVELAATVQHPYSMPYEHFDVWLCRDPKVPFRELWPKIKKWI